MDLILVGLNHEKTPIDIREKFAFSPEETGSFLQGLSANARAPEAMLLSTCNRTELYARLLPNGSPVGDRSSYVRDLLAAGRASKVDPSYFYSYEGVDAVRHIFRVASGLNSMIVGEGQIQGQVKDAYGIACKYKTNGFLINKIMHTALRVGRRARNETEIGAGAVSISMAAVELSQKIFRDLNTKRALVVGAGEMATLTAEHFISKRIGKLLFTNRTMEKAASLAGRFGGETAPWTDLAAAIASSDIVVTSTRSPEFLVTADIMRSVMRIRKNKPVFLIDIAVPRNIDPAAGKIYNVFAHNIDDLKQIVDRNLVKRRAEANKVEHIIEEEIAGLLKWRATLSVTPTIKSLMRRAEEIRSEEIERSKGNFTPEQHKHLDALTNAIIKKMLHTPITKIKECAQDSDLSLFRIEACRDIFGLTVEPEETHENEEE